MVISRFNLRFAGYCSAWQCALRDDGLPDGNACVSYGLPSVLRRYGGVFCRGATFVLVREIQRPRLLWDACRVPRHHLPNVFR
ncbi:hypothetical protein ACLK19_00255 [Escherichia coli]